MRISTMMMAVALAVAGCNGSKGSSAIKKVSGMVMGTPFGIQTDGDKHVAYLVAPTSGYGTPGELHLTTADGKDTKIADNIYAGGYLLSPRGSGLVYSQKTSSGDDAALFWVDMNNPTQPPRQLFAAGLQTQPISPGTTTPTMTAPLSQVGFLSPSGRYFVVGVLPPNVAVSWDMHVIDLDNGNDVYSRGNGAFAYLELVLPDDTMIFTDAVGGNDGPSGAPGVQTLFWVGLGDGTPTAQTIATRPGAFSPSGDNKWIVYSSADTRALYAWDAVAKPASGTQIATNALSFAVGGSGPVAYVGTDQSLHVVGVDGKPLLDVDGATAKADLFSPVYISDDGADVYYFQGVNNQNAQGTLMHVAATAGATPAKVADAASLSDVHPLADGLLFLQNVDGMGTTGDAYKSARDGSGAAMIDAGVPVGFLQVVTKAGGTTWLSPHLAMSTNDKNKQLIDGVLAVSGQLDLTSASGNATLTPMTRIGQYAASDDLSAMVYVDGAAYDAAVNNWVGALTWVDTSMPTMKQKAPLLTGVSEVGPLGKRALFVNAPKAMQPGVYFVSF